MRTDPSGVRLPQISVMVTCGQSRGLSFNAIAVPSLKHSTRDSRSITGMEYVKHVLRGGELMKGKRLPSFQIHKYAPA